MSLRNSNNGVQRPPNPGRSLNLGQLLEEEAADIGCLADHLAKSAISKGGLAAVKACASLSDLGTMLAEMLQELE